MPPSSADAPLEIDVRFVPRLAPPGDPAVRVVVDEIRASTTLTTLIELGCPVVHIGGSLVASRRLARETGSLLVGERQGRRPAGFDLSNSPVALRRAGAGGRSVVLSTTNGTATLRRLLCFRRQSRRFIPIQRRYECDPESSRRPTAFRPGPGCGAAHRHNRR